MTYNLKKKLFHLRKKLYITLMGLMSTAMVGAQDLTPIYGEVDCGEMIFNAPATYIAEFRNTSATPVTITSVDTGCGCTLAKYPQEPIQPNATASIVLTFDCRQLGHFARMLRVFTSDAENSTPAEMLIRGVVVTKIINYSGEYPYKMGTLLADRDNVEFDDINEGQRLVGEIHIMNPSTQNASPVLLRLPSYLTAEMHPAILGPRQKGVMRIVLNSKGLRDYGLNQTTVFLGKNNADKVTPEKQITISAVLLPPAVSKDDVNRPYSARLSMSKNYVDMSPLQKKSKYKDEIIITNKGHKTLEIQKLQLFTIGVQVGLDKQKIEPGEQAKLTVTCKAKDLKKLRVRPRILMITNDPDNQKVILEIKK